MRLLFSVLVASVAFAGTAFAGPNENLFGNTVVITSATGGVTKAMINKDGTYTTALADGKTVKGTWAAAGDQTCYTQTDPAPAADAKPFCTPNEARNVGDTWEAKAPDGSTMKFALQAGQ
ncbi:MAG: hypothetical protein K8R18_14455 [Parvibaculum sp.]|uniref:hypothetical protein n=1 Tax=Parvibaculum sp. TaxID=2024848 RepID=UPI0025E834E1|nr:hypothetical protein [Parvibaculum sp.]MCE9650819.1 hypothetical protein [Parvibaculum sp.]